MTREFRRAVKSLGGFWKELYEEWAVVFNETNLCKVMVIMQGLQLSQIGFQG